MTLLQDHSVLIVGGGSGLGRGVARRCRQDGANLTILEVSRDKADSLRDEFGDAAVIVQGDCTNLEDLERCRQEVLTHHGRLDAAMCFQGIWDGNVPLADIPADRVSAVFDEIFHINVLGYLLVARVFHDLLKQSRGALVLTSSNAAYAADGGGSFYTATKGAICALVRQLAFEFSPEVRVNAVAPGAIGKSELRGPAALQLENSKQSDIPEDVFAKLSAKLGLIPGIPKAEDYAIPFMFLGSRENRIITGQTVLAEQGALNRRFIS